MKPSIQSLAWKVWRGHAGLVGRILSLLLLPAEGLWRMATAVRNQYFDRQCQYCIHGFPVVSVGNLAVGGTGKTPIASWIVSELRRGGSRPAILHGKSGADEALLHYHWTPKVPVLVEDDRRLSLKRAREIGADIAILDDGFQDFSIQDHLQLIQLLGL